MKFVLWTVLILFITVGAGITYLAFSPTGKEMRSIENGGYMSLWGDHTNMGQIDAFGFNLKDKYETEYLIGVDDGFADRVTIEKYTLESNSTHEGYVGISDLQSDKSKVLEYGILNETPVWVVLVIGIKY
jgi:hypothetical protein